MTRLTGISPADVEGRSIDAAQVEAFVEGAALVTAHNARFDRPFAEAFWPVFEKRPWACSCTGVDWIARGCEGARLGHLLVQAGFFHDAHRALDDVVAMLHLLDSPSPVGGTTAFAELLAKAREPSARVWAEGAPYRHKDTLRRRAYRWSDGSRGLPRAWYRDVPIASASAEAAFLRREIYEPGAEAPRIALVTAYDRYSDRAGAGPLRNAGLEAARPAIVDPRLNEPRMTDPISTTLPSVSSPSVPYHVGRRPVTNAARLREDQSQDDLALVFAAACTGSARLSGTTGLPLVHVGVTRDRAAAIRRLNETAHGSGVRWQRSFSR